MSDQRPIFVRTDKGDLVPIYEQSYESESVFQAMLAQFPELLLPGDDRTPYSKLLLIKREKGVPTEKDGCNVYYLDHLFVDQSGIPTLVEVKRKSDPRNRRESVAQMLDYAANGVVTWGISQLREEFEKTCRETGNDPETTLHDFLNGETDEEGFWQQVEENLAQDRIRMVFVADQISVEVRRITEFLNRQMASSEMIAIELRQFVGGNVEAYVPDVIVKKPPGESTGGTGTGTLRPAPPPGRERFLAELGERMNESIVRIAEKIMEWSDSHADTVWWGRGRHVGSYAPGFALPGGRPYYPVFFWTYGKGEVQFQYLRNVPPFNDEARRRELLERFNAIPGIALPEDGTARRPSFPMSALVPDGRLEQFFGILSWLTDEVRKVDLPPETGRKSD